MSKLFVLLTAVFLLQQSAANADEFRIYVSENQSYVSPREYFDAKRDYDRDREFGKYFPFGPGGIEGPFRNPDSSAREPQNLTACMYNASGILVYERKGKVCPYKFTDANVLRIEQRRREWLSKQAQ